jgi:hypothetical protein
MVAPTSGVLLGTDEIGAVLSGDESGPDFYITFGLNSIKFYSPFCDIRHRH